MTHNFNALSNRFKGLGNAIALGILATPVLVIVGAVKVEQALVNGADALVNFLDSANDKTING